MNVQLCRSLSTRADWQCDPAGNAVGPGPLFFYARLRSPRATRVRERWYRDDRLQQEMTLSVGANPWSGYRTYSRKTMTADSAGDRRKAANDRQRLSDCDRRAHEVVAFIRLADAVVAIDEDTDVVTPRKSGRGNCERRSAPRE